MKSEIGSFLLSGSIVMIRRRFKDNICKYSGLFRSVNSFLIFPESGLDEG